MSLDAISAILAVGVKYSKDYASLIDESDGITTLENLQNSDDDKIYQKAVEVIETYFAEEEEVEGGGAENLAPGGMTFDFGFKQNTNAGKAVGGMATAGIMPMQMPMPLQVNNTLQFTPNQFTF